MGEARLSDAASRKIDRETEAHEALEWAQCGAMDLTGFPSGPPLVAPAALATACRRAMHRLEQDVGAKTPLLQDPPALLGERAAIAGLSRQGDRSPGGHCRILGAADGWLAVNLARPEDAELLPAWLERPCDEDPWSVMAQRLREGDRDAWVERARLLGLAVAPLSPPPAVAPAVSRAIAHGKPAPPRPHFAPLVVDFSSLWAGPLCTQLLADAGARVVKVESRSRPDGARNGSPTFFDLLNGNKPSVAVDFADPEDRRALDRLLARADIVVESARPRALAQWGIDAKNWLEQRSGRTWLGLTGYGRPEPAGHWVAFGDDAAAAAGLCLATSPAAPVFCGDAIADPLAGIHAAAATAASWKSGGGQLLDVSLRDVVAHLLVRTPCPTGAVRVEQDCDGHWQVVTAGGRTHPVAAPRAREPRVRARPLAADNSEYLREC